MSDVLQGNTAQARACYFDVVNKWGAWASLPLSAGHNAGPVFGARYSTPTVTAGGMISPTEGQVRCLWLVCLCHTNCLTYKLLSSEAAGGAGSAQAFAGHVICHMRFTWAQSQLAVVASIIASDIALTILSAAHMLHTLPGSCCTRMTQRCQRIPSHLSVSIASCIRQSGKWYRLQTDALGLEHGGLCMSAAMST